VPYFGVEFFAGYRFIVLAYFGFAGRGKNWGFEA
jgi:hypothetical protein